MGFLTTERAVTIFKPPTHVTLKQTSVDEMCLSTFGLYGVELEPPCGQLAKFQLWEFYCRRLMYTNTIKYRQ